jgi:cysteine desulfurase
MKKVFMDYASTTPVDPVVIKAMEPFFNITFGNPSSIHAYGREALDAVDNARKQVASLIYANASSIVFTSGGTESDNLAIKGIAYQHLDDMSTKGPHIITSVIEHPAVLEPCRFMEKLGFRVEYLPVDEFGVVDVSHLENIISKDTFLVSVMAGNNEVGTTQPLKEIGAIARDHDALFHSDAVQGVGKLKIDVNKMNIDLLSLSSHKIYGPKGVGALYVKKGVQPIPLLHGGGHEQGLRSTTINTAGVIGLGKACELGLERFPKDIPRMQHLRDNIIKGVLNIEESYLNGHPTQRLVNNAHFRFTAVEGESLLLSLDDKGIAAATGSACSSKKLQASHVLLAMGINPEQAHGSIRLTIGRTTTQDDVDYVLETLPDIVQNLRKMSPLWNR